ncbi:pyridoxamine 5'-phosphate oxidase family protein [Candidatus Thorarchaeota archaeon]|nr:MAG: pyridoxamine 5'-phosphate oxidase family protein [Candidatus Thorarchaeota archaeon]
MNSPERGIIKFIDRDSRRIEFDYGGFQLNYPLNAIPESLYNALATLVDGSEEPMQIYGQMVRNSVYKPAVISNEQIKPFGVNAATKIVRLTLTDDEIEKRINEIEGVMLTFQGRPFEDTMSQRIELYKELLIDDNKIDRMRLGVAEMFGLRTYNNLLHDPRCSLAFSWYDSDSGQSLGFQINCLVEIVHQGDPFYRYMRVMRSLFSRRFLDLEHEEYICAYKMFISEVIDKSLASSTGFSH